mgnify:CR=1 FL=1
MNSGEVGFPEYLRDYQFYLQSGQTDSGAPTAHSGLSTHIISEVNTIITGTNPYEGLAAFDPDSGNSNYLDRVTSYEDEVDSLNPDALFEEYQSIAVNGMSDVIPTNEDIDAQIEAEKNANLSDLAARVNRFAAGMFDINAVVSTVFPAGLALAESEWAAPFEARRTELKAQRDRLKLAWVSQSIDQMLRMMVTKVQAQGTTLGLRESFLRFEMASNTDQLRLNAELNALEAQWDLGALLKGLSSISAISGIPAVPEKLTPFQSIVGGLGTVVPLAIGVGTAVGSPVAGVLTAVVGGALISLANSERFGG